MVQTDPARRVLVVEDDVAVAAGISEMLLSFGYAVSVVHTGGEALPEADRFRAEVVVLDVNLPDLGGEVVFRLLRQRWPSVPVVFSSAHVRDLREVGAAGRPHVALLQKPYEGEQLIEAIESVLGSR